MNAAARASLPRAARLPCALLLLPALLAQAAPEGLRDALGAGELICEFRAGDRGETPADLRYAGAPPDLLLVYEQVRPAARNGEAGSAQVLSTRNPGRKEVSLRSTALAVHLMQSVGPSVMVTTLTGCSDWRLQRGEQRCLRFAARHAWHFDTSALHTPDAAEARAPRGAYQGSCEAWSRDPQAN